MALDICPITLKEANEYVLEHHRHHKPVVGHKFSIACTDDAGGGEKVVGVAIVGRPVSRYLDDGLTLEVTRLCTDGTRNACSMLYAASWRASRAMGYKKLITYILDSESGVSLRASGWKCVGQAGGLRWTGKRRPTVDLCPAQMKIKFEKEAQDGGH
ncbi:MAG: XF1762 family protein [Lachnospirales bacterium]